MARPHNPIGRLGAKGLPPMNDAFRAKLFDRMFKSIKCVTVMGCWQWGLYVGHDGYGKVSVKDNSYLPHRVMYELLIGPPPTGDNVLDHTCHNRACLNPAHMEAVSNHENTLRGVQRGATHCKHGHEFSAENTAWYKAYYGDRTTMIRQCRTCNRTSALRRYYANHDVNKAQSARRAREARARTRGDV